MSTSPDLAKELRKLELAYNAVGPLREIIIQLKLDHSKITVEEVSKLKDLTIKSEYIIRALESGASAINNVLSLQHIHDLSGSFQNIRTMHVTENNKQMIFTVIEGFFDKSDEINKSLREEIARSNK